MRFCSYKASNGARWNRHPHLYQAAGALCRQAACATESPLWLRPIWCHWCRWFLGHDSRSGGEPPQLGRRIRGRRRLDLPGAITVVPCRLDLPSSHSVAVLAMAASLSSIQLRGPPSRAVCWTVMHVLGSLTSLGSIQPVDNAGAVKMSAMLWYACICREKEQVACSTRCKYQQTSTSLWKYAGELAMFVRKRRAEHLAADHGDEIWRGEGGYTKKWRTVLASAL